jgi:ElaB/YqjD/DUF883 family membrane-anchored ribosome-binding protein
MKTATIFALDANHSMKSAKRAVRKSWRATEEFVDEARTRIKKDPLKAVGITFGIAAGIGAGAGWLASRR